MTAAAKTLAAALVAAQKQMPAVEPNAVNPHFRSKFVSLDHLIAKTRPVLNDNGLAISQFPAVADGAPVLRTVILHADSGETLQADTPLFLNKQDMQQLGAAITYARRYAWASALGISADEDDDGNSTASNGQTAAAPAAEPPPKMSKLPTAEQEAALTALVGEKGGDVPVFTAAMETARSTEDYGAWFEFQRTHWHAQKKPFVAPTTVKVPAGAA